MTSLLLPHLSSSLTDSLPSLNLLCYSFMQDGRKAVWSIHYVSVAFFPSLKQNFIAYRSSKVSSRPDCIFEIHQLWQSGFSRVYSNCCCSCWFEPEIIKMGQSSHKMYSNNIVNFQESTTISNSGNLLNALRIYIYIYIFFKMNRSTIEIGLRFLFFIFCFYSCFWLLKSSSGSWRLVWALSLVFIVVNVLMELWLFLIPGFVFINVLLELIVHNNLWPLQICIYMFTTVCLYVCVNIRIHVVLILSGYLFFRLLLFFL